MVWKRENIQWAAVVWMTRYNNLFQTRLTNHYLPSAEHTFLFITTNGQASADTDKRSDTVRDQTWLRPHRVPLLSVKNRTWRIQFTQTHQNWTIDDWKNVAWSDESRFLLYIQMVGSVFGIKNMKAWIHLCQWIHLNISGWWWWCNGVGDIYLAHFGTNWASFKHHSLPEYCCWPCPSLYDYSVPSSDVLPAG